MSRREDDQWKVAAAAAIGLAMGAAILLMLASTQ
jgi:hypothetical protein